jgi:hypothetical protein
VLVETDEQDRPQRSDPEWHRADPRTPLGKRHAGYAPRSLQNHLVEAGLEETFGSQQTDGALEPRPDSLDDQRRNPARPTIVKGLPVVGGKEVR